MEKIYFKDIYLAYSPEELRSFAAGPIGVMEEDEEAIRRIIDEAERIVRPKAVCGIAEITDRAEDWVKVDGIRIGSKLVARNLQNTRRVFPYVATCGTEIEEWAKQLTDPLEQYWADQLMLFFLGRINAYMHKEIRARFFLKGHMSAMNPGSLEEWPLPQQEVLFRIIGNVTEELGVRLTDSFLMLPHKSTSGFYFSSKEEYENCQFCPLLACPNRRASYIGESGCKA